MEENMDSSIFEVAYACLIQVCDMLNIDYVYDEQKNKELLKFLIYPSKRYDNIINSYPFLKHEYDIKSIKRIMFLIVVSRAYIKSIYNIEKGIDIENSQLVNEFLTGKKVEDVLELIEESEEILLPIIDLFFDFAFSLFVETCMAKELVFMECKLKDVLDINPFEILDIYDYIPSNKFTDTEILIQKLFNYYNMALTEYYPDSNNPENTLIDIFLGYLSDEDENTIIYIVSNVYESICTQYGELSPTNKAILRYIESNDNETITNRIFEDHKFANTIIDLFIGYNDTLTDQELLNKRERFKLVGGNISVLKRLNPFYDEEEIVYDSMKRSREK